MRILRLTFLFAIISGFVGLSSCKDDKDKELSTEELQLKKLTKTWVVSQIRFGAGNTDRTSDYAGMELTISGTFNTNNVYNYSRSSLTKISPWPKEGTWSFDLNDPGSLVIRNEDNLPITYSIDEGGDKLQLTFTYVGDGEAGRKSAVEGTWVYLFDAR